MHTEGFRKSRMWCGVDGMRVGRWARWTLLLLGWMVSAERGRGALPADHAARMTRGLETFQRSVRPVLLEHCVQCHGGEKTKGELDLTTREALLRGGAEGEVVVPFRAEASRLLRLVRHAEEPHMPAKKPKLPDDAIARLTQWVDDGAPYDRPLVEGKATGKAQPMAVTASDRDWWAFRPLNAFPKAGGGKADETHWVDRMIAEKAAAKGLALAPEADRRVLVRRAYLDLVGLPPTTEEVEAFVRDPAPDAWPQLIDRLLASPHYGERWARHWLDVARFAESSGFEHDSDREGAFHYRDFVIRALNLDLPYDQFVRWQVAGDEFAPDNTLALAATGFLGAGVFPTQITANEVERTRYDAMDDMLSTVGSAFLGLTIGCARCHDHKYDPVPTADYYRMLSAFTTTVRSVVELDVNPDRTRVLQQEWEAARAPLVAALDRREAELERSFGEWLAGEAAREDGEHWTVLAATNWVSRAGATFKAMPDGSVLLEGKNGAEDDYTVEAPFPFQGVAAIRLDALADASMKKQGPGRSDNGNFALSRVQVECVHPDGSLRALPVAEARADFEQNGQQLSAAATLDDDAKTGWAIDPRVGQDHAIVFRLTQPVFAPAGASLRVRLEFRVSARHQIGRPRVSVTAAPVPQLSWEVRPPAVAELLYRRQGQGAEVAAAWTAAERTDVFAWWKRRDALWQARARHVEAQAQERPRGLSKVLICGEGYPALRMNSQGADFFNETYQLKRGNTELKGDVATLGFLQVLMRAGEPEQRWRWQPPKEAKFSGRRRSLANWLTDVDAGAGALLARVMVNRMWQHHFGKGLVATPNDFGRTGARPTHPELLDALAAELIRGGWKLKALHRTLLTSALYRQRQEPDARKQELDPNNDLWVRRMPWRLEGEIIRDAMLAVSGALDERMYGPGTKDEASRRRSIYFTVKRSQMIGSMVAFDQPEPLVSQGSRPTTTVAPQALFLMNGPHVREWAEVFARGVLAAGGSAAEATGAIAQVYRRALGRSPSDDEGQDASEFVRGQRGSYAAEGRAEAGLLALADLCQVLFGLNEFAYQN